MICFSFYLCCRQSLYMKNQNRSNLNPTKRYDVVHLDLEDTGLVWALLPQVFGFLDAHGGAAGLRLGRVILLKHKFKGTSITL